MESQIQLTLHFMQWMARIDMSFHDTICFVALWFANADLCSSLQSTAQAEQVKQDLTISSDWFCALQASSLNASIADSPM